MSGAAAAHVFDRRLLRMRRTAAALAPGASAFDYLRREVAGRLGERLDDIAEERGPFPVAVDVGAHAGGSAALERAIAGHTAGRYSGGAN